MPMLMLNASCLMPHGPDLSRRLGKLLISKPSMRGTAKRSTHAADRARQAVAMGGRPVE